MSSAPRSTTWPIEPHTIAKHEILRRYLEAWFPIILQKFPKAVYVDGFCGPGKYDGGEDGSPIIALREALKYSDRASEAIELYFFDEDEKRIEHLKSILDEFIHSPKIRIFCQAGKFVDLMQQLQTNLRDAPLFVFIDPFGLSGIPMQTVHSILSRKSAEVFINIMGEYINRFLEHPNVAPHLIDLFGSHEVFEVKSSPNRLQELRLLYQKQLLKSAKYVKFFQMRNNKHRPIYDLFFASNNALGYTRMKDAFWKVDPTGAFSFSDATNPNQLILLTDNQTNHLEKQLRQEFAGQQVDTAELQQFVNEKTIFRLPHLTSVLINLEQNQVIEVLPKKKDGRVRRKNTFPIGTVVKFS